LNPIETEEGLMVLSAIVDISDRKQKEERIQAALKEKDILLAEIHHRVKNNLQLVHSLLDLQSARIQDAAALSMLRDSRNRVQSMAMIHQILYESKDFATIDFGTFLHSLVPALVSSYSVNPGRVGCSITAVGVHLPLNIAIPCGLLLNELISNSLKHAFPGDARGEIVIDLGRDATDHVVLAVTDDGVGIASDFDVTTTATLGLQLVTLLAEQVGAELTVRRANPTRFTLRFPIL
jgi:two-component sensor histidine kinase